MRDLVFDTETTDLIDNIGRPLSKQPYVIEFFGITVEREAREVTEETLSLLIKPPFVITETTTQITGITAPMLVNAPTFSFVAKQIKDYVESHDRIVAHNAGYDKDMLEIEFKRLGVEINLPEVICTIEGTEHLKGYRLNLGALHTELFGADFADHHRAEPDTRATARCYVELLNRGIL
jgi:DNA polymerase III epsilon subunit-like protein